MNAQPSPAPALALEPKEDWKAFRDSCTYEKISGEEDEVYLVREPDGRETLVLALDIGRYGLFRFSDRNRFMLLNLKGDKILFDSDKLEGRDVAKGLPLFVVLEEEKVDLSKVGAIYVDQKLDGTPPVLNQVRYPDALSAVHLRLLQGEGLRSERELLSASQLRGLIRSIRSISEKAVHNTGLRTSEYVED